MCIHLTMCTYTEIFSIHYYTIYTSRWSGKSKVYTTHTQPNRIECTQCLSVHVYHVKLFIFVHTQFMQFSLSNVFHFNWVVAFLDFFNWIDVFKHKHKINIQFFLQNLYFSVFFFRKFHQEFNLITWLKSVLIVIINSRIHTYINTSLDTQTTNWLLTFIRRYLQNIQIKYKTYTKIMSTVIHEIFFIWLF